MFHSFVLVNKYSAKWLTREWAWANHDSPLRSCLLPIHTPFYTKCYALSTDLSTPFTRHLFRATLRIILVRSSLVIFFQRFFPPLLLISFAVSISIYFHRSTTHIYSQGGYPHCSAIASATKGNVLLRFI